MQAQVQMQLYTIKHMLAGMYDGTVGVIGAIEALAALKKAVSDEPQSHDNAS